MSRKHVHFASRNTYHSPPVHTPSLTFSPPSSASSSGPFTPPSIPVVLPGPSPYKFNLPPRRPQIPVPIQMHSLLQYSYPPPINFDLTLSPSTISTHHHSLSGRSLSESATNPPLLSLKIVTSHLPRGGTMAVAASQNGTFVTVGDVLNTIYHALRTNISSAEYHSLPSQKDMSRVSTAYEVRCQRIRDRRACAEEKRQGVRRVDFLMGVTKFMGLSRTSNGEDVWLLNTA